MHEIIYSAVGVLPTDRAKIGDGYMLWSVKKQWYDAQERRCSAYLADFYVNEHWDAEKMATLFAEELNAQLAG